jgi:hypothetical protein
MTVSFPSGTNLLYPGQSAADFTVEETFRVIHGSKLAFASINAMAAWNATLYLCLIELHSAKYHILGCCSWPIQRNKCAHTLAVALLLEPGRVERYEQAASSRPALLSPLPSRAPNTGP